MRQLTLLAASVAALVMFVPGARAEKPSTILVHPPKDFDTPPNSAAIGPGTIIYFNRNGGTYTHVGFGQDDAIANKTSLPGGTLSPFACGDAAWQEVMDCLRESWGPFNVTITDQDPGSTPHVETVVAGTPTQVGQPANVGGIAPASCLAIDRPISYAFANVPYMGCDPQWICWTATQETAHYFGLDHEVICKDPQTYDTSCGTSKRFQDQTAQCGEVAGQTHSCFCGGSQQNSVQKLTQIFGARVDQPPTVEITEPADGATVQVGFAIKADASDDIKVTNVELFIDGQKVQESQIKPYIFLAPSSLTMGSHTITVRASDKSAHTVDASVQVTVEPPCTKNEDCDSGQVCNVASGQCSAGPGEPGGLGSTCTDNAMCDSKICAAGPDGMRCVTVCTPGGTDCPDGFDCLAAGGSGACWPGADVIDPPGDGGGTCGCRAGGSGSAPLAGFLLGFAALAVLLRRRR